jgi:hypothetical protein
MTTLFLSLSYSIYVSIIRMFGGIRKETGTSSATKPRPIPRLDLVVRFDGMVERLSLLGCDRQIG